MADPQEPAAPTPRKGPLRAGGGRGDLQGEHREVTPPKRPGGRLEGGPERPLADVAVKVARQLSNLPRANAIILQPGNQASQVGGGSPAVCDLLIRNSPLTSQANVEIHGSPAQPAAYGTGIPLLIGDSFGLTDFAGPIYALCDPAGAGPADVRVFWDSEVPVTVRGA